jgi:hypothetical protein
VIAKWELWAFAHQVLEQHGEQARAYAIGRRQAFEAVGDSDGVDAWVEILARIEQLQAKPDALE